MPAQNFMSNRSAENPGDVLNRNVLKQFFSVTGEPGSFQDYGALFGSSDETPYNALDPSLAIGVDGEPYLSFGSYFEGIFLTKLDRGLIKTAQDAPPPPPKPSPDGDDGDVHIQRSEEDAEEETLSNTAVSSRSGLKTKSA